MGVWKRCLTWLAWKTEGATSQGTWAVLKPEGARNRFSTRASRTQHSPAWFQPIWTSKILNCEIINLCCFKLLNLRWFVYSSNRKPTHTRTHTFWLKSVDKIIQILILKCPKPQLHRATITWRVAEPNTSTWASFAQVFGLILCFALALFPGLNKQ